jgi:hypothetical protein
MPMPQIRLAACAAVAMLALTTLATASAAGDSHSNLVAVPKHAVPPPDRATVVLVREQFVRAKGLPQKNLFIDRQPLGLLHQKSLLITQVRPGMHTVEASSDCAPLVFEADGGETRLFRLREVINALDVVETSWIEDDPATLEELVEKHELKESQLSPAGQKFLAEKRDKLEKPPADEVDWLQAAMTADSVVFRDVLFDRPFRKDDVSRSFTEQPGVLVLTPAGIVYQVKEERFALPWSRVDRMRFAGSRFDVANPWVGFEHDTHSGGTMVTAFSDQREAFMAQTYGRIYAVARRFWRDAKLAEGTPVPAER